MGINYSYLIAFEKESVDEVLKALASAVDEEAANRIRRSLPWGPETEIWEKLQQLNWEEPIEPNEVYYAGLGFQGLEKGKYDSEDMYYFFLHIPFTRQLQRYCNKWGLRFKQSLDFIDIGYVWTSINVGEKYGILELKAPGSRMSYLFSTPGTIDNFVIDKFAGVSKIIIFDDENTPYIVLHPKNSEVDMDDFHLMCFIGGYYYSADKIVETVMERAKIA